MEAALSRFMAAPPPFFFYHSRPRKVCQTHAIKGKAGKSQKTREKTAQRQRKRAGSATAITAIYG